MVLAAFALGSCADLPPLPKAAWQSYLLDTGDTLHIIVYNQQSLTADYLVGDDGMVSFPMVGEVRARSLTVEEFQKALYDKLNSGVFVNPGLSVQLAQCRPIYIMGEVVKPGQYPYVPKLNVLEAVAVAEGFTMRADKDSITVIRRQHGKAFKWSARPTADLQPGDVVVIREEFF